VNLNGDKLAQPDFFICTASEAKRRIKDYTNRGILNLHLINNEKFKDKWDKIK